MIRRLLYVVVPLLCIAGATAWWYSPARAVERRTETLLTHLSIQPHGGVASRQAVVYALDGMLAPQVAFSSPDEPDANGEFSSQEIAAFFSWLAEHSQGTKFEREQIHAVRVQGDHAEVDLTIHAQISMPQRDLIHGRYRVQLDWVHDDGRWVLISAKGQKVKTT